jgi:hypothetical protein
VPFVCTRVLASINGYEVALLPSWAKLVAAGELWYQPLSVVCSASGELELITRFPEEAPPPTARESISS